MATPHKSISALFYGVENRAALQLLLSLTDYLPAMLKSRRLDNRSQLCYSLTPVTVARNCTILEPANRHMHLILLGDVQIRTIMERNDMKGRGHMPYDTLSWLRSLQALAPPACHG